MGLWNPTYPALSLDLAWAGHLFSDECVERKGMLILKLSLKDFKLSLDRMRLIINQVNTY
jgi:hypothetical protein